MPGRVSRAYKGPMNTSRRLAAWRRIRPDDVRAAPSCGRTELLPGAGLHSIERRNKAVERDRDGRVLALDLDELNDPAKLLFRLGAAFFAAKPPRVISRPGALGRLRGALSRENRQRDAQNQTEPAQCFYRFSHVLLFFSTSV